MLRKCLWQCLVHEFGLGLPWIGGQHKFVCTKTPVAVFGAYIWLGFILIWCLIFHLLKNLSDHVWYIYFACICLNRCWLQFIDSNTPSLRLWCMWLACVCLEFFVNSNSFVYEPLRSVIGVYVWLLSAWNWRLIWMWLFIYQVGWAAPVSACICVQH